jgi:hypothetical protein
LDPRNPKSIVQRLSQQAHQELLRITIHANQEMLEEDIRLDDVVHVLKNPVLLENYPDHQRGSCCLVCGTDDAGRHLHIVCTTSLEKIIVITTYEPKPPKWPTPFMREKKQ